jgi:SAM-dependent methyltransferase
LRDWIHPNRLEDFSGKSVLDAGCGPGHHARLAARFARRVVGLDLNTAAIAREKTRDLPIVEIAEGDAALWDSGERFDAVYCVGVVHHTLDPDRTVAHLRELLRPGGRLILWVYSAEGNWANRFLLEPLKKALLRRLPRPALMLLAHALTLALVPAVHTVYRLPLPWLPFHEYFANFRRLGYRRNFLNVFDKLNAPRTHFITRERAEAWTRGLSDAHLSPYVGVSWRISGTKPHAKV